MTRAPAAVRRMLRLSLPFLLVACGSAGEPGSDGDDGGDPSSGTVLTGCPRPEDPWVHYISQEPAACDSEAIVCTVDEQYGFNNACGCGCLDKGEAHCPQVDESNVRFYSHDPANCAEPPVCLLGETPFNNDCGCGCINH
jgi:hypothetical protein